MFFVHHELYTYLKDYVDFTSRVTLKDIDVIELCDKKKLRKRNTIFTESFAATNRNRLTTEFT